MNNASDYKLYKNCWVATNPKQTERLSEADACAMLDGGGILVRNTYDWDCNVSSFWYVIKDTYGGLEELSSKVRNQVRKSLRTYDVRKVSGDEMFADCFDLFNYSRERFQDKKLLISREQWRKRCGTKGAEFWVAYDKETHLPQAFAINYLHDTFCDYSSMGVNPRAPKSSYPMYGLIQEMNRYYLEELKLQYVCDGARSITEHSNIQPFLEDKFKFRKAYCQLQIFYKPWFGLAIKILFPFRKWVKNKKVAAILRQEAWAKECYKKNT